MVCLILVVFIATNVRVTHEGARGEKVRVETPFGSLRVRESRRLDPKAFGVPIYPGAVPESDENKAASIEFSSGDDTKELAIVAGAYTTTDSADKVMDFYRKELPHWIVKTKRHGGTELEFSRGGYKRIVAIKERGGLTRIGLASVGEPAAN